MSSLSISSRSRIFGAAGQRYFEKRSRCFTATTFVPRHLMTTSLDDDEPGRVAAEAVQSPTSSTVVSDRYDRYQLTTEGGAACTLQLQLLSSLAELRALSARHLRLAYPAAGLQERLPVVPAVPHFGRQEPARGFRLGLRTSA